MYNLFINVVSIVAKVTCLCLKRAFHGKVDGRVGGIGRALLSRGQLAIYTVSSVREKVKCTWFMDK